MMGQVRAEVKRSTRREGRWEYGVKKSEGRDEGGKRRWNGREIGEQGGIFIPWKAED